MGLRKLIARWCEINQPISCTWVVESESKNIQQDPKLGIKPGTSWTFAFQCFLGFMSSLPPFNPPTLSHQEPWPQGCVHACACVSVCVYMCACECLSPQRYCTLQCRATLCSLDVLCLYSHWSLWMKTPLLGLFSELVYPPVLSFSPPRPLNDALYTTYIPVSAGALPLIFFFSPSRNKLRMYRPHSCVERSKIGEPFGSAVNTINTFWPCLDAGILENG